jgi:hypothetical protein
MECRSLHPEDLRAEERSVRELQIMSDLVVCLLTGGNLALYEALLVLKAAKRCALKRFPDKEETYELVYGSRFRRIMAEKMALASERN